MDRNEDHVIVPVHQFHNLMDTAFIVRHLHETAENTHTMVDMDDVIADIEGAQVVERQLLGLFHRTTDTHPMEAVEYFVIGIAANPILIVDESRMDVLPLDELRQERMLVLQHDGTETLKLRFLLTVDVDLVIVLQASTDVGQKEFKVLVEDRLRRNIESNAVHTLALERNIKIYMLELQQFRKERPVFVHIGRIQPHHRILLQERKNAYSTFFVSTGDNVGIDIGLVDLVDGKLRIAVEGMDLLHLVSEESKAIRVFQGVGKYVNDCTTDGILPRCRYEVNPFKPQPGKDFNKFIIGYFLSSPDGQERTGDLVLVRHRLLQGGRIGNYEERFRPRIHNFADGGCTLHTEGGFVVAPFDGAAAVGKEENGIAFHQIIQVGTAIFGRFPGWKDDEMGSFFRRLG